MKSSLVGITALLLLVPACAHHRDVRPGGDGINTVKFKVESRGDGFEDAMSQAENYCEKFKKRPVLESENSEYVGSMKESTYNAVKTGAHIAMAGGVAGAVLGGQQERKVGGAVAGGSSILDAVIEPGYEFVMRFKCVD